VRIDNNIIPVILVVYKSKNGYWHGFCHPYDVSCNAEIKEEVINNLEELVETYEKSLERYGNPIHLIEKKLSDKEDQEKFKKIWPYVSKKIAEHIKTAHSPIRYSQYLSRAKKFSIKSGADITYSHRSLSLTPSPR